MRLFAIILLVSSSISHGVVAQRLHLPYPPRDRSLERPIGDSTLSVLGHWSWGYCLGAAALGDKYVVIGNGTLLQVLDISSPQRPTIVSAYDILHFAVDIRVRDSLAYVLGGIGLVIVDYRDPSRPKKLSELGISGGSMRLFIQGNLAYITTWGGAFLVVDISNPVKPTFRGGISAGGMSPRCLAVSGKYAYVGNDFWPDLLIIDCSNPDTLKWVDFVDIGGSGITASIRDTLLYVGVVPSTDDFRVYDLANPTSPKLMGFVSLKDSAEQFALKPLYIYLQNNYAYVSVDKGRIFRVNIDDPSNPFITSKATLRMNASGSQLVGVKNLLCAASYLGLTIQDLPSPDTIKEIGFFPTAQWVEKVAVQKSVAYVADGDAGLWILNVADPQLISTIANFNLGGHAYDIIIDDTVAYVATSNGLWIIGVSSPDRPHLLGNCPIQSLGITKSDNLLYSIKGTLWSDQDLKTIEVIDIKNQFAPKLVASYLSNYPIRNLAVRDSFLFVATSSNGLRVIDWHLLDSPAEVSTFLSASSTWGVALSDSLAFLDRMDSLFVINIQNPRLPAVVAIIKNERIGSFSYVHQSVKGSYLYWAGGNMWGAIDISNPFNPAQGIVAQDYYGATSVFVDSGLVYVASGENGLWVIRCDLPLYFEPLAEEPTPREFRLFQNYPNPFNPSTTVQFSLPRSSLVTIKVYDLLGQEVATLIRGHCEAGRHNVSWTAFDLPNGVYFCRFTAETFVETKKMLLLK